jgi:hypothetical protein
MLTSLSRYYNHFNILLLRKVAPSKSIGSFASSTKQQTLVKALPSEEESSILRFFHTASKNYLFDCFDLTHHDQIEWIIQNQNLWTRMEKLVGVGMILKSVYFVLKFLCWVCFNVFNQFHSNTIFTIV